MKKDLISYCVIFFCTGVFVGFILTTVYIKDVFEKEVIVSITPVGWTYHPYTHIRHKGKIDRQTFKVYFKNGVQVFDEWEKYTYN